MNDLMNIHDRVEAMHLLTVERKGDGYLKYLTAIYDSQAVEGKCSIDDTMAALTLRNVAAEMKDPLSRENLDTLVKSLRAVLRRHGLSRIDRREEMGT
jgi:hypothetical protein